MDPSELEAIVAAILAAGGSGATSSPDALVDHYRMVVDALRRKGGPVFPVAGRP